MTHLYLWSLSSLQHFKLLWPNADISSRKTPCPIPTCCTFRAGFAWLDVSPCLRPSRETRAVPRCRAWACPWVLPCNSCSSQMTCLTSKPSPACVSMAATLRKLLYVLVSQTALGPAQLQQQLVGQLPDLLYNISRVVRSAHVAALRLDGTNSTNSTSSSGAAVLRGRPANPSLPTCTSQGTLLLQLQTILLTSVVHIFHGLADMDRRPDLCALHKDVSETG